MTIREWRDKAQAWSHERRAKLDADQLTRVLTLIEAAKAMDAHLRHLAMHGLANPKPDLYIVSDLATALADLAKHGDITPSGTDTGRSTPPA